MVSDDDIVSFMQLFVGNARSYGKCYPNGKMSTAKGVYGASHFKEHLDGNLGLGLVPILDDNTCKFGAIDIDAHGEDQQPIDHVALSARVAEMKLPLVLCRSRSGRGVHLFCFAGDPGGIPTQTMRSTLARWADMLGYGKSEIFPKQERLVPPALGNWINLPYFGDARLAVDGGREVDLSYFIELARSKAVTVASLAEFFAGDEFAEAPPCLQRLIAKPIPMGENIRNNSLVLASTFFKKAYPDNFKNRAFDFNLKYMAEPLAFDEAKKTINSVGQKDYGYRCKEEPCATHCDRQTCLTRKFGVSRNENLGRSLPQIARMVKFYTPDSSEVRWEMTLEGGTIYLTGNDLIRQAAVRAKLVDSINCMPPLVKDPEWVEWINDALKRAELVELPSEATEAGFIKQRLHEWLRTSVRGKQGEDRRGDIATGKPARIEVNGEHIVAFKLNDFRMFLKRTRTEGPKGLNLQMVLQQLGVDTRRIRLDGEKVSNLWYVNELEVQLPSREPVKYGDPL